MIAQERKFGEKRVVKRVTSITCARDLEHCEGRMLAAVFLEGEILWLAQETDWLKC
jgi:hypothetical protein